MLKKYIRSMLESYRGSHKSVPFHSGPLVLNKAIAASTPDYVVASADGLMVVQCESSVLAAKSSGYDISACSSGGAWPAINFPVKKGQTIEIIYNHTAGGSREVRIYLYPYVGS